MVVFAPESNDGSLVVSLLDLQLVEGFVGGTHSVLLFRDAIESNLDLLLALYIRHIRYGYVTLIASFSY